MLFNHVILAIKYRREGSNDAYMHRSSAGAQAGGILFDPTKPGDAVGTDGGYMQATMALLVTPRGG